MHLPGRFGYSADRLFNIWTNVVANLQTLQDDVLTWCTPSLALVNGNVLGSTDFSFFVGRALPPDRSGRMEEMFDAVAYLGPRSSAF
jgi:hypothetical protein